MRLHYIVHSIVHYIVHSPFSPRTRGTCGTSRHVAARRGTSRHVVARRGTSRHVAARRGASRRVMARKGQLGGASRRVKASAGVINNGTSTDSLFLTQVCLRTWLCRLCASCHTSPWAEFAWGQALRLGVCPVYRIRCNPRRGVNARPSS